MLRRFLLMLLWMMALQAAGQPQYQVTDLKPGWLVYEDSSYTAYAKRQGERPNTIYFWLEESAPGTSLLIRGRAPFDVFVNGQLAATGARLLNMNADSLARVFASSRMLVAIHQVPLNPEGIGTELRRQLPATAQFDPGLLGGGGFKDFVIIGMLVLTIMLLVVARLNPKLATDYLAVRRILSSRETDDVRVASRITSSTNILFYVYSSLMLAYYLMVIFHFIASQYTVALPFVATTFGDNLLQWIELSSLLLAVMLIKIVLVFGLSYLFGMREVAGIHFFNWVRLLVVVFGTLTVILFTYCITHGQNEDFLIFMLKLLAWILGGWMILIFLKLRGKTDHSMFHLFSYICATEVIPFLITLKVLYN